MKKSFTHILALCSVILLMLASCKKDETKVVVSSNPTPGTLTASATSVALSKSTLTSNAVTFTSTTPNFGYSAAVTTTLQISPKGNNFATKKEVVFSGKNVSASYTVQDFNNILLGLNLPTGTAAQVEVRMQYTISNSVAPVYSNVVTLTATPFALTSYIYVPGTYQNTSASKQWQPATADSLVSTTGNGIYTGYIYFQGGDSFKITPAKTWDASYGDAGSGKISLSASGNLTGPTTKGLYLVTVDLNAGTIIIASAPYNSNWSLIGDAAIDWNTDIDMPFNQNANAYQATVTLKTAGAFKFRADHAWTTSLGDVAAVNGQLTASNGTNIVPPANGTYLVSLSFGNPLLGPTYTLTKQ